MRLWEALKMIDKNPDLRFKTAVKDSDPYGNKFDKEVFLHVSWQKDINTKEPFYNVTIGADMMNAEWTLEG